MVNVATVCSLFGWHINLAIYYTLSHCNTPQSSILKPTTVKRKVKGQEAKIVKVKGQT